MPSLPHQLNRQWKSTLAEGDPGDSRMIEEIRPLYDMALIRAAKLLADVPDERMAEQPVEGCVMNHAAWTIGHLAFASDNGLSFLGLQPALDHTWKERFAMGSTPVSDRLRYPAKQVLLAEHRAAHERLLAAAATAEPEVMAQPSPERMRDRFPTIRSLLLGLMTAHEANHLGQLSAWRRAMGFAPVI
jgi:DinB superfamily